MEPLNQHVMGMVEFIQTGIDLGGPRAACILKNVVHLQNLLLKQHHKAEDSMAAQIKKLGAGAMISPVIRGLADSPNEVRQVIESMLIQFSRILPKDHMLFLEDGAEGRDRKGGGGLELSVDSTLFTADEAPMAPSERVIEGGQIRYQF
ncbi:hypothetical protein CYMTET_51998 [Cymbomonas tetramitiformis]|uniref:Uncharacterized protein n=1 Tax=Cymbomonas tetramitiformis TaxID=36881 RepID=A0AAE0BJW7_9CHLO|nr:hypothetical protein CYMTET_51998 [Cymbomonas tetramitiformis]